MDDPNIHSKCKQSDISTDTKSAEKSGASILIM